MSDQTLRHAHAAAFEAFADGNAKSKAIYDRATESLPGGNTRTVLFYEPFPISIASARGSKMTSVDGKEYVDFLGEYTAGLYGHSEPVILEAITQALSRGLSFGSHNADEAELAALVRERFPSIDLLRFTNSGTEANLMAIALAKIFTKKSKVLVFSGGYHGGVFLFKEGYSSPLNAPHEYLIAKYNDVESVEELVSKAENANDLAAIVVEPMIGSSGAIPGDHAFLAGLRQVASKHGAVLIFDEVMTSRLYRGRGVQGELPDEAQPDLTTLGKWIGGGMSFGCFGGKREIMELFDPRNPGALAHAGTFNNNVLTMAAGRAGLEKIFTPDRAGELHEKGEQLRKRLQAVSEGSLLKVTGCGSLMNLHFTTTPVDAIKRPQDVVGGNTMLGDLLHLFLLEKGYYVARRGFIALSLAISDQDIHGFVDAVKSFIHHHQSVVMLN
ncbi:class III aminotransferase [Polychaeton citri CBS 116435]|uniref:Class III aminotransferase n=1 Tax=Polychaeton citri CBS 116435 TaxID=1314669 RepID=A0A9P4UQZ9_9PEZI|nr:class III aminotransferase [Polychaeton citri CBS 116435]